MQPRRSRSLGLPPPRRRERSGTPRCRRRRAHARASDPGRTQSNSAEPPMAANRPVRAKECLEYPRERVAPNVERDALTRHVEEDLAVDDATRVAARVFHRSLFSGTRAEAVGRPTFA